MLKIFLKFIFTIFKGRFMFKYLIVFLMNQLYRLVSDSSNKLDDIGYNALRELLIHYELICSSDVPVIYIASAIKPLISETKVKKIKQYPPAPNLNFQTDIIKAE